jgi:hypothetical protein
MDNEVSVSEAAPRARWSWLAALGLVMIGLAPLLMLVATLVWGLEVEAGEVSFLAVVIVIPLVAAFLVWRFGTWAKVLAIVVALAGVGAMFWTAFGLAAPNSFFDFVPGLLVIPGAIIAIAASVGAIVAARRGHLTVERTGGERRAVTAVIAVVGVLAALSGVLTVLTRSTVGSTADVHLASFAYDQSAYAFGGGSSIVVRNDDPFLHTFTIDTLGIDVALGPNSAEVVEIPAQPGTYVVYCRPHTSNPDAPTADDMASQLTVDAA